MILKNDTVLSESSTECSPVSGKPNKKHCARLCSCSLAWSIRKGRVLNSETKVQTPANLPKSKSLICMSPWVSVVQLYLVAVFQFLPVSLVRILIRVTLQQVGRAQIIWKRNKNLKTCNWFFTIGKARRDWF